MAAVAWTQLSLYFGRQVVGQQWWWFSGGGGRPLLLAPLPLCSAGTSLMTADAPQACAGSTLNTWLRSSATPADDCFRHGARKLGLSIRLLLLGGWVGCASLHARGSSKPHLPSPIHQNHRPWWPPGQLNCRPGCRCTRELQPKTFGANGHSRTPSPRHVFVNVPMCFCIPSSVAPP